MKKISF